MDELKPCPLCGKPLILRTSIIEGEEFHSAYCHCGFSYSDDCKIEDFVEECNRRYIPNNKPLPLKQIENMIGEPVWIFNLVDASGEYKVIDSTEDVQGANFIDFTDESIESCSNYGKTWLAYANNPEFES